MMVGSRARSAATVVAVDAELLHADLGVLVARRTFAPGRTRDRRRFATTLDGGDEAFAARRRCAMRPARRSHRRDARVLRTPVGEVEEQLIVEHLKDGQIDRLRFLLTPMPKLLHDGQGLRRKERRAADAPVVLRIVLAHRLAGLDDTGT